MGRARGYIRDPLPYPLLLGLCCLSFLTTRASGVCPEFRKYQDEHVAGGRYLAEIPGLSRCQAECLDTQDCSGVDYRLNGCWIHTSQVADEDIQPLDGNTFYRLVPCQSGCTLRYPTRDDVTAPVDVVIRRPGVTRTECQVECRAEDRCVSFLHNDRENTCYLATNPVTMTTRVRANTTHYGKQLDCNGPGRAGCNYTYYGEYGTTEYMELSAPSVTEISQCCEMCCRKGTCIGVTFHLPSASQCRLLIDMSRNRKAAEDLERLLDGTVTYMRASDTGDGCSPNPCLNGALCIGGDNGYLCVCPDGFNGLNCGSNINECLSSPCQNGGTCNDGVNGYTCRCVDGVNGVNCQGGTNECLSAPCQNGGTCNDGVNGYTCRCVDGFSEVNCQVNINECSSGPCQNGGTCDDGVNGYTCRCVDGFNGVNCQGGTNECLSAPCENGGTCDDGVNGYTCRCADGFNGVNCQVNINECASVQCQNGGTCDDGINGYTCRCGDGFNGVNCQVNINECLSSPCQNGGTCDDGVNGYTCRCVDGFNGVNCQGGTNECLSAPCQNGGTCDDGVNRYTCRCVDGFSGVNCQVNINECSSGPCQNGGNCNDGVNGYTCRCVDGFNGVNCQVNINECSSGPCQNGGTCDDSVNGYTCRCADGFNGVNCQVDVNECSSDPCQNGGICNDGVDGYTCLCVDGFNGVNCQVNINECLPSPCQNGGTCHDGVNGYTCRCADGFNGVNCQVNINECASSPCQNGGTCLDATNSYSCNCLDGFSGTNCEVTQVSCVPNPCQNQATCTLSGGASQCQCLEGYSGSLCESVINPWHGGECGRSKYADAGSPFSGAGVFIVGGQEARPNEFPWQVQLRITKSTGNSLCGGTILNRRWILTAAHCVTPYLEIISTEVTAGQHVRSVRDDFEQIFVVPASATYVHEDYDSDAITNDVALLKLPTAIEFNDNVLPACSPTESNLYENTRAVVSGWGLTTDAGSAADTLMYIPAVILPNTDCSERRGNAVPDGQMCIVDGVSELRGVCQGDSGGPITVQDPTGRFHVLGAASFVLNQCADDLPDFYVRATFYFSWISSKVYQDIPPSPWYANCLPFPCVNGGSCVDNGDTYRCDCVLGFTGTDCQTNIDECASNPCQNGANCVDRVNGYSCTCQNGFTGNECEINTGDILHAWYDGTCGAPANPVLAVHPLIAGGVMAEIGQLPWQVRVVLYRRVPSSLVFACTGAILNKRWVSTSIYCLQIIRSNVDNFEGYLPAVVTQDGVAVEFTKTEDHPGYSPVTEGGVRTRVNDVALLRLSTDMVFTQNAQPVCPPDLDRSYVGETAVLAGWGEQQDGGESYFQLKPLYVSMEITDPSVCETAYADVAITQFPFDQRTLCDDGDATKGFCTNDWGAPLVVKDAANRWRLVGTASWKDGCNSDNPGVYSRIDHFLFWITQQIHRDSQT